MKRELTIILIIFAFLPLLSGCAEEDSKSEANKFVGKWTTEDSMIEQFIFYENGECKIKTYGLDATYNVSKEDKILIVYQKNPAVTYEYEYKFGYNYEKLTLQDTSNFESWIFRKED